MEQLSGIQLITGAGGFVGGHLVAHLRARGARVRAMVRSEAAAKLLEGLGIECVVADMTDPDSLRKAVQGVNGIFHIAAAFRQAGVPDRYYEDVNVAGTRELIRVASRAGVRRFVHCSTVGVLGDVRNPPGDENTPYNPGDIYQVSKMEGEKIALEHAGKDGMEIVVIRPAMIYGPGDLRTLKLFRAISRRRFFYVGAGEASVHFVDVRDLARAFELAMVTPGISGRTYIIGGETSLKLRDLAEIIASELGVSPPWLRLPVVPLQLLGTICEAVCKPFGIEPPIFRRRVDFFTKNRHFCCDKAARELGFKPQQSLRQEVRDIIDWYSQHGYLPERDVRARSEERVVEPVDALNSLRQSVIVRSVSGAILYWNKGAERRYGFSASEAIGAVSHNLLKTEFPDQLDNINQRLLSEQAWCGELLHTNREGERLRVRSTWQLSQTPSAAQPLVLEINRAIDAGPLAPSKPALAAAWIAPFLESLVPVIARCRLQEGFRPESLSPRFAHIK